MSKRRSRSNPPTPEGLVYIFIAAIVVIAALFYFTGTDPREISAFLEKFKTEQQAPAPTPAPEIEQPQATPSATAISGAIEGDIKNVLPVEGKLTIAAIDVGQGDSLFIQTPDGKTMLIDGGEKDEFDAVDEYLQAVGVKSIDVLVATHPHSDHIGSLKKVVQKYDFAKIYMPPVEHTTNTYLNLLEEIKSQGKKIKAAKDGGSITLGEDVKIDILHPEAEPEYEEMNNYSVVLKLTYKNATALFMGDAEKEAEQRLLKLHKGDLKADLLKVGHHGSSSSTTSDFLDAVSPTIALICVGNDNSYEHPSAKVIQRLEHRDALIFRTNLCGTVAAYSDGSAFEVAIERAQ